MASKKSTAPSPAPAPATPSAPPAEDASIALAALPPAWAKSSYVRWYLSLPIERRHLALVLSVGAALFLPWLGATGFWDPWEPHYGEVGRSMIARQDFIHPYWESAYFYSKPVLTLWMDALSMLVARTNSGAGLGFDPTRGISLYTEWCVRLPYALLALAELGFVYLLGARLFNRRVGLVASLALATCPMYWLLARQAVTDTPFVAINTIGFTCLMLYVFGNASDDASEPGGGERYGAGWLYAFYACVGLGTLAKESLGVALPGATFLAYLLVTREWKLLLRLRLVTGTLVVLALAAPWYTAMLLFNGRDDESKTFAERLVWDNFRRFFQGVHTTTPGGTFVYFIEQLGFGVFPWVAALPGAFFEAMKNDVSDKSRRARAHLFVTLWAAVSFALFAMSATKFHHYCYPILPPLMILCAAWVDRLLVEGARKHAVALLLGGALYGLVAQNLWMTPKHLTDLFVYNYDRPYPDREVDPRRIFSGLFSVGALLALWPWIQERLRLSKRAPDATEPANARVVVAAALLATGLAFAGYGSLYHWRKLTPHWSQRDIFWTYLEQSKPGEPLAAYFMNWRGETFYSRNTVRQIKDAAVIQQFVAPPGREWIIVEHARLAGLKQTLGSAYKVRTVDEAGDKFALVVVE